MKETQIWELDFARGFAIIMMIFDHLMYDLMSMDSYFNNFRQVDNSVFNWLNDIAGLYWGSTLRFFGHLFFITVFLVVSGISFTFSKSNLNRSIKLLVVAALITVVTYTLDKLAGLDIFIIFGIIHMYAFSIFLTYLFRKIWNNDIFILVLGVAIIIVGISFNFWEMNYIRELTFADMPGVIFGTKAYGADYFGIFPYWGMIMIGTVIGNVFYKNKMSLFPKTELNEKNIVIFAGQKSLIIFLTHQFVIFGLMYLIGLIFGYRM